jgi:S1-C subfamily serine protease
MLVVGAAAAMAAVAWVVVLLSPASDHSDSVTVSDAAADAPLTTLAATTHTVPPIAETAGHSMVLLRADTPHGVVYMTGVAVAEGGLVATTADALSGWQTLSMVGQGGRLLNAQIMGIDPVSDVALVTVPVDLPVAPFADDTALGGGSPDMTLTLAGSNGGDPTLRCMPGSVSNVGDSVADGPASGMPGIVSSMSTALVQPGDALLNSAGAVIGLLYESHSSPSGPTTITYLPSQLVLGVADDLRSVGKVAPGWLGVVGANSSSPAGATVMAMKPGSPAAGSLQAGDVIVGVNSVPVRSMAELRARVYVLGPNTEVDLSVLNGTVSRIVDLTLGTSP